MKKVEISVYFLLLLIVFVAAVFLGYQTAKTDPDQAKSFVEQLSSEFGFVKLMPPILIFAVIFLNNSIKALLAMISGIFFGIAPVFFVFVNGYIIGMVFYIVGLRMGFGRVAMMLIPHGIVEIPAILLACSYGVWLGRMFLRRVRGEEVSVRSCVVEALRGYVKVVVPLLLVAAFVETFITPHIA